ncbi:hypothetical protein [Oceanobacillus sp. CAU 1775]
MKKPRSDYEIIRGVINKEITEEEFFKNISDSGNRIIIDQPMINSLKREPHLLREFLLSLSVQGRFRIILMKEMLGMTQTGFSEKYGVSKDILRILKGQHDKVKSDASDTLREVLPKTRPPFELYASLAIMTRIPVEWLLEEQPDVINKWDVSSFKSIPNVLLSQSSFIKYLEEARINAVMNYNRYSHTRPNFTYLYDIRPIILTIGSNQIFSRASIREQGDILIELFGVNNQLNDFVLMKNVLEPIYSIDVGYCKTVINNHVNLMIVMRNQSNDILYPIEFIKI